MNDATNTMGKRNLGFAGLAEAAVRIGQLEALSFYRAGGEPELWTVARAGRWVRTGLDLGAIRRTIPGGGRALAKACARLARG